MSNKKRKPLGILTGASFSLKKLNRKARRLLEVSAKTIPLLPNGMPDFTAKCKENSPFDTWNRKQNKIDKGTALTLGLVNKCNMSRAA